LCDGSTSGCNCRQSANSKSRTTQEATPINAAGLLSGHNLTAALAVCVSISFFLKHGLPP
jgi:hypothetical protein